jgi:hypothetical protein
MNKSNWKGDERFVAKAFGTERTPLSGGNSKHTRADTLHSTLFIEVKKRKKHAVFELWKKTAVLALKEKKIPVIALRAGYSKYTLLVIEIHDLAKVNAELKLDLLKSSIEKVEDE